MLNEEKYQIYKQIFKMKESVILKQFLQFIRDPCVEFECSYKKVQGILFTKRFNIFYFKNFNMNLTKINYFVKRINKLSNVTLDQSLVKKILNRIKIKHINWIACGIDQRERLKDSRIKIWIQLRNYPEKVEEYFRLVNATEEMRRFFSKNNVLMGVEMFLNGKTNCKIYSYHFKKELQDQYFIKCLCNKACELINFCDGIFVLFKGPKGTKTIYFRVQDHKSFFRRLPEIRFNKREKNFQNKGFPIRWISFYHDELLNHNITEYNVYY